MSAPVPPLWETPDPLVFGVFEFHSTTLELKRNGERVRLQEMPARILDALLRNPGQLVTRDELRVKLWPSDTFVQFDAGLNTAMNKLRFALRDSATNPQYIETVPRTGYRFVYPVQRMNLRVMPPPELPNEPKPAQEELTPAPRRRTWMWVAASAILMILIAIGALFLVSLRRSRPGPTVRFAIDLPAGQEFRFYSGRQIAISPGGSTLAWIATFNGIRQIYVRPLNDTSYRPIPATEGASALCFSPDGDWLVYYSLGGYLAKASVDGRVNTRLTSVGAKPASASLVWGNDDWIYFSASQYSGNPGEDSRILFRIRATGGEVEPVMGRPQTPGAWYPQQWLPGGLLYSVDYAPTDLAVEFCPWDSRKRQPLIQHASGGRYIPTGHMVFAQSGNLMAEPFDLGRMQATGTPVMVAPDVAADRYAGLQMDVSTNGTLVYFRHAVVHEREPVWVDMEGRESSTNLPAGRYHLLDLSADGRNLLLTRYDAGERWTILAFQLDTRTWKTILSGDSPNTAGIFSPDGRTLALTARYQAERFDTLYLKPFDSPGGERPLLSDAYSGKFPQSWSHAANALLYSEGFHESTKRDIYVLPMIAGAQPQCIACTPEDDIYPSFSPDGRWIAYTSGLTGRFEVYVRRYPGDTSPVRISPDGGEASIWAPSGRELYFHRGDGMWAIPFDPATGTPGKPRKLFGGKYDVGSSRWNRDLLLSTDGTRFLLLKMKEDPPDYRRIQVVLNWFEELLTRPGS
jgi:DNA-binding winged helix-turn-helix (wHTH) protein/Tol biopolymer transport system component